MKFRRKEREQAKVDLPMAPLIDVVFQLLIFFMVASTFSQVQAEKDIKLPIAEHSRKKETSHNEMVINVRKDGTVVLDQIAFAPAQLAEVLAKGKAKFGAPILTIRADKGVPHGNVLNVLAACAYADIWDISIATYQEEPASYREGD